MSSFSRLSKYSGPLPVSTTGQEEKKSSSNDSSSLAGVISQSIPPEHQSSSACQFAASHLNPSSSESCETKTAENGDKLSPKIYDLPKVLLWKISSFLSITDLQAAVCASKKMNESVIAGLNDNGTYSIKHFINKLIQKLDEKKYPEQKKQLVEIEKNITLPNSKNLRVLQKNCLGVKEQVIKIIKTLEETPANKLKDLKILPSFFEDVFDLVEFERNIDNASLIPNNLDRENALSKISRDLAKTGHFDRAIRLTSLIPDDFARWSALSMISTELANAGHFDRAIRLTSLISHDFERWRALSEISIDLAKTGHFDRAIHITTSLIPHDLIRWRALSMISTELANAGHFDRALSITSLIPNDLDRELALSMISRALANAGHFDRAIRLTSLISDTSPYKTRPLKDICDCLRKTDNLERAIEVALLIPNHFERSRALSMISTEFAKTGHFDRAIHITSLMPDGDLKSTQHLLCSHDRFYKAPLQSLTFDEKGALQTSKEKTETSSEEKKD